MPAPLRQIHPQRPEHKHRTWYNSPDADLYLWHHQHGVKQFEFCFDKNTHEKSIRWQLHKGCSFRSIDSGDRMSGLHIKRSAILQTNQTADWQYAARQFRLLSDELPIRLRHFILVQITNELMTCGA